MDWMEQNVEMMKSWTDMQKKMWEGWMDAASGLGKPGENPMGEWLARWQETAKKSMDVLEDLTRKVVENEGKWAGSDATAGYWPGKEEQMKKMAESWTTQTLAVMKSWTEAQRKLWDSWFEVATTTAKSSQSPGTEWYAGWQDAARRSMEAWDDLSKQTMETQADWFQGWVKTTETEGAASEKAASGKKSSAKEA